MTTFNNTEFSDNPVYLDYEKISYASWRKEGNINIVSIAINGIYIPDAMKIDDDSLEDFIENLPPSLKIIK